MHWMENLKDSERRFSAKYGVWVVGYLSPTHPTYPRSPSTDLVNATIC